MKFLKTKGAAGAPQSDAVAARLNAVTCRGKVEVSEYFDTEQAELQVRKRFWSPDEVEGGHE